MKSPEYHQKIVEYYRQSEDAYKDSWDLKKSLAIHYGYRDEKARSFPASLARMNEVMAEEAGIGPSDKVLDAGCGVGGSSIFLAHNIGCQVTGITLSERQAEQAQRNAEMRGVADRTNFQVMNYSATNFPDQSFDVVWGCESICYADDKAAFIREAFRLLKPGGRLIVADGFVTLFDNNENPINRQWLDGWQVNYLETMDRFAQFMREAGFTSISKRDITKETSASATRLYRFYFPARLYLLWMKLKGKPATEMQRKNVMACKFQFLSRKKGLSCYGIVAGIRPHQQ